MAHHSSDELNKNMLNEIFGDEPSEQDRADESFERMPNAFKQQMNKEAEKKGFGATDKYPKGRISDNDEGELQFGVADSHGRVILNFGKQVTWLGMMPSQARQLAKILVRRANAAEE